MNVARMNVARMNVARMNVARMNVARMNVPSSRAPRPLAFLALVAPLLAACGGSPPPLPPSAKTSLADKPVPDFKRRTLEGGEVDTTGLRGRTVVVKFFAEYCEPCMRTLPAAQALSRDKPDVAFIGISEDETQSKARGMVERFGLTFPVVHDPDNILSGRYRVNEMPATFVISKSGVVRWFGGPDQTDGDLSNAIEAVRAGD